MNKHSEQAVKDFVCLCGHSDLNKCSCLEELNKHILKDKGEDDDQIL